jgi:hypothetical protein
MSAVLPAFTPLQETLYLTCAAGRGLAYLLAWVAGLAVWPSNLDVAASDGQVMAAYAGHRAWPCCSRC